MKHHFFGARIWIGFATATTTCFLQAQTQTATNASQRAADFASLERNGKREAAYVHDPSSIVKCKEEYFVVNWGACCRGVNSTYEIRVGRSREITGPYLDKDGVDLMKDGGTLLLGNDGAFIGPGHAGIFEEAGQLWFSCHFYDSTRGGTSMLAIRPLRWDADGWPLLEPVGQAETNRPPPRIPEAAK